MRSSDNTEIRAMTSGGGTDTNTISLTDSNDKGRQTAGFGSGLERISEVIVDDTDRINFRRTTNQSGRNCQHQQSDTRSTFPLDAKSSVRSSINRLDSIREEREELSITNQTKTANDIMIPQRISEKELQDQMKNE